MSMNWLPKVDYPEIEESLQPRHRFMSAFEQRVEPPDKARRRPAAESGDRARATHAHLLAHRQPRPPPASPRPAA